MKTLKLFIIAITMMASCSLTAQVAVTNDGSSADGSAMLEVKSTEKGFLPPRMTKAQIEQIQNPADGLMVYNTEIKRFFFFDASSNRWNEIALGPGLISTGCGTVTDIDGNTYSTVQIGPQCWMKENLATTKYNDGSNIPHVTDNSEWADLTTPGYCWYNNDKPSYGDTYGALYNWYTVINITNLCPDGWHVPSYEELDSLFEYLETRAEYACGTTSSYIAKALAATSYWSVTTINCAIGNDLSTNNLTGFTALPGGVRESNGIFYYIGDNTGGWWCVTPTSTGSVYLLYLESYTYKPIKYAYSGKNMGFSVRCLKD